MTMSTKQTSRLALLWNSAGKRKPIALDTYGEFDAKEPGAVQAIAKWAVANLSTGDIEDLIAELRKGTDMAMDSSFPHADRLRPQASRSFPHENRLVK